MSAIAWMQQHAEHVDEQLWDGVWHIAQHAPQRRTRLMAARMLADRIDPVPRAPVLEITTGPVTVGWTPLDTSASPTPLAPTNGSSTTPSTGIALGPPSCVCHRRFGKSVMTINETLRQAAQCVLERPRFAYMAPLYRQAKTIAWDYLRHYASPIPGVEFNEQELACTLPNGARIELLGAQDYHYLRGRYLDGIVLDEYAYMVPEAWTQVIRPALVDRKGWAVFIGTPLGRNHFFELYEKAKQRPEFLTALWPASQTGIVPADELEAARRDMAPEEYEQEFECSFEAAIRGAYYAKEITAARADGRIRQIPIEPVHPRRNVVGHRVPRCHRDHLHADRGP